MSWALIIVGAILLAVGFIIYERLKTSAGQIIGLIGMVVGAILLIAGIAFLVMAEVPGLILPYL